MRWRDDPASVRPMLATLAEPPLTGSGLVFEPKYDGIRALAHVAPRKPRPDVRIWSRLGNEKTAQFPAVVRALEPLARSLEAPLLLDGEIVALDDEGRPAGFQQLQGRIHVRGARDVELLDKTRPTAFIAFDLLRDGDEDIRGLPLTRRRERLEAHVRPCVSDVLRLSEQAAGDGRPLDARAHSEGWEGLIVKEAASPYQSGRRSPAWRKRKLVNAEEFVVGGWTEPRRSREHIGALLLGAYDDAGKLRYVGHAGGGFTRAGLEAMYRRLARLERKRSPFADAVRTNEPAHWVRPSVVVEVKFSEWTADGKLRQPIFLGVREDKAAREVTVEAASVQRERA